jgi:hypothetical protein
MSILGELERFFATVVYPNRIAFAIALLIGIALLASLARRRHWDQAIRAHPRRAAAIVVPFLLVGLPLTWVLASPLFIRSELVEAAPPGITTAAEPDAMVVLTGTFVGADEFHTGGGRASILEVTPGAYVLRFDDFSVLNGPDLHVYLSREPTGYADRALDLGKLKATDGSFNYEIPPNVDVTAFRSVVIWCQPFEVQFAHAELGTP